MNLGQVWEAIVLGIIQGLTEFLPISSSAHLILLPWFLNWDSSGIVFDVVIHGGTLLAVLLYFRKDWKVFSISLLRRIRGKPLNPDDQALLDSIIVGTIPAIIVGGLFKSQIEIYARQPVVTVVTLSLFGALLWWADRRSSHSLNVKSITVRAGLLIGLAQATALVPGVSRSGVTITAALLLGFTRPEAARYSFLLAGPIIALGALSGLYEFFTGGGGKEVAVEKMLAGVFTSFFVGFLCIKFFLQFLKTRSYLVFAVYRFLLAGAILFLLIRI